MRGSRNKTLRLIVAALLVSGSSASASMAQGEPAVNAIPELGYLIGEWTVRSFSRSDSGEFVEADRTTSYRARHMHDGLGILAEFYEENREAFYSVHLISRASEAELVHYYLNARKQRRLEFRGRLEDREYHLSRAGGYGGGDFLYKEIDSEIHPNSFVKRIYQSDDAGQTWVEGDYYFRFERIGGPGVRSPATGTGVTGLPEETGPQPKQR